jgi:hypothetical protein
MQMVLLLKMLSLDNRQIKLDSRHTMSLSKWENEEWGPIVISKKQ